jgi:ATP-dependent DNA helicase RecG
VKKEQIADLYDELNSVDEHPRVDAKTASEVGTSVMETLCAYANEPGLGGGYLLLGVKECEDPTDKKYCVVGIENPDKIQRDVADQCASRFNRVLRPECVVGILEGKPVIGVFMQEAQPGEKPIFFKKVGLPKGAFRRIGSTNQHCTDDDLQTLYQSGTSRPFDETIVSNSNIGDLDPEAIAEYRKVRAEVDSSAEELRYDDNGLLESLSCIKQDGEVWRPTVAGMILFGTRKALRKFFPMMRLDYIRVPGRTWVEDPDHPFETIEMRDSLFRILPRGLAAIMDDIPRAFSFSSASGLKRQEEPRIPQRVIREALVNALMHRNYQIHGPAQVIRYANRLEILNPGHSLKPLEQLGEPGSKTRNPTIATVLHETKYAENKGSGIRVMQRLMEDANLSPPSFESDRDHEEFTATFLMHHFLDKPDIVWLAHFKDADLSNDEARVLILAREFGFVNNEFCRNYTRLDTIGSSVILRKLRDLGLLKQHAHAQATYYTPTDRLLNPESQQTKSSIHAIETTLGDFEPGQSPHEPNIDVEPTESEPVPTMARRLSTMLGTVPTMPPDVPTGIIKEIKMLGLRSPPSTVQGILARLCSIRAFTADELARVLNRNKKWVKHSYLSPMIREGVLEYTLPDQPKHPSQAYRTKNGKLKTESEDERDRT